MGYTLRDSFHVVNSDTAADAIIDIEDCIIKRLRKVMKTDDDFGINTDGVVNAAMIVCDCFSTGEYWKNGCNEMVEFVAKNILPRLRKYIEKSAKISNEEWNGADNKRLHLAAYRKLEKRLQKMIE